MTTRELYNATINFMNGSNELTADELVTEFHALLEKMDSQAEARRAKSAEKAAAKQAEKAPIRDALLAVMGGEENPMTATALIEAAGLEDVKPASVPSLLRPLVESGIVMKVDVKVTGKGTQRGYVRA